MFDAIVGFFRRPVITAKAGSRSPKVAVLERIEWIVAIMLSATVLFLLIVRTSHVGALWRDECDSVQLAQLPRLRDVIANLHFTSFPVFFSIIVRCYTAVFGASDFALRCFSLIIGALFICAAWFHSLSTSRQPPLFLLALIGLNTTFLTAGTWLRGYGVGSVLMVVTLTLTVRLVQRFTFARLFAALLMALAASQCLFFNGALMPAIIVAATAVFVLRGELKPALWVIGIGLVIAIAYIPYILSIYFDVSRWAIILQEPTSFSWIWNELNYAFGAPSAMMRWVWVVVVFGAVAGAIYRLLQKKSATDRDVLLFGLVVIAVSLVSYCGFMWVVHKPPLQRYYLIPFCVLAAAAELIMANLCRFDWVRLARIGLVTLLFAIVPFAVWPIIIIRETNTNILARRLEQEARQNDVILINTWSRGISFNRYYHGSAPWLTVPQIQERRIHRYDLLQAKMMEFFPLDDLERAMTVALKTGNRVWLVGEFKDAATSRRPLVLAPAPDPKFGWRSTVYSYAWTQQLLAFLRRHALKLEVVAQPQPLVNRNENSALILAEGWEY